MHHFFFCYHSILLIFLARPWVIQFLPQPSPRNCAFKLGALANVTLISQLALPQGLQQACPTLCPVQYPLTFLPPTLLPSKSQERTLFLLTLLSPHQPDLCRLVPHSVFTPLLQCILWSLHLSVKLLVLLLYFSSSLPFSLYPFPHIPPSLSLNHPLADH